MSKNRVAIWMHATVRNSAIRLLSLPDILFPINYCGRDRTKMVVTNSHAENVDRSFGQQQRKCNPIILHPGHKCARQNDAFHSDGWQMAMFTWNTPFVSCIQRRTHRQLTIWMHAWGACEMLSLHRVGGAGGLGVLVVSIIERIK